MRLGRLRRLCSCMCQPWEAVASCRFHRSSASKRSGLFAAEVSGHAAAAAAATAAAAAATHPLLSALPPLRKLVSIIIISIMLIAAASTRRSASHAAVSTWHKV